MIPITLALCQPGLNSGGPCFSLVCCERGTGCRHLTWNISCFSGPETGEGLHLEQSESKKRNKVEDGGGMAKKDGRRKNRGIRESCRIIDLRNWGNGKILMARGGTSRAPLLISSTFNLLAISKKQSCSLLMVYGQNGFMDSLLIWPWAIFFLPQWQHTAYFSCNSKNHNCCSNTILCARSRIYLGFGGGDGARVLMTSSEWSLDPHRFTYVNQFPQEKGSGLPSQPDPAVHGSPQLCWSGSF